MIEYPFWPPVVLGLVALGWLALLLPWRRRDDRESAEAARQRAERLLAETLAEEEFRQLTTQGYLDVQSPAHPTRSYRVYKAGGPVQVREEGRTNVLLCVQPVSYLPEADVVLLHKLLIEGCEQAYLKTANVVGWRDRSWLTWLWD
ncbi:MAG: hypothetical protein HY690_15185 [Chloroflexi bacterium]|nr:hypothetical protein [Chloroflexota bacterium]